MVKGKNIVFDEDVLLKAENVCMRYSLGVEEAINFFINHVIITEKIPMNNISQEPTYMLIVNDYQNIMDLIFDDLNLMDDEYV